VSAKREARTLARKKKKSDDKGGAADALLAAILKSLDDHKAEEVVTIDLKGKSSIADYMVIASGRSGRQVVTMAEHLLQVVKQHGVVGVTPEGMAQADWVLLDAGDVIVHLFRPEVRAFYNLEKMWQVEIPGQRERAEG
jgi:ribosome-associated protein